MSRWAGYNYVMAPKRYSAYIGASAAVAEDVLYATLLSRLVRFTAEAAAARSVDEARWEQEELRRHGLSALAVCRNSKAVWKRRDIFDSELAQAQETLSGAEFAAANELDTELLKRLDRDLRKLWRVAGYETRSLTHNMKGLFTELESDIAQAADRARSAFVDGIMRAARNKQETFSASPQRIN